MTRRMVVTVFLAVVLPLSVMVGLLVGRSSGLLGWMAGLAVMSEGMSVMVVMHLNARMQRREVQRSHAFLADLDRRVPPPPESTYGPNPEWRDF